MLPARRLAFFSAALVALAAVLAVVLPAGIASAAGRPAAETRVWAFSLPAPAGTRADRPVFAGQRPGETALCPICVPGACVAPEAAGSSAVRLWRVAGPNETADIARTGAYRAGPNGLGGKYFYPTSGQAENLANLYAKAGIGGPYSLTSGSIDAGRLAQLSGDVINPAGEGTGFFIPGGQLPSIFDVLIHGPVP